MRANTINFILLIAVSAILFGCNKNSKDTSPHPVGESSFIYFHDLPPAVYNTAIPDPAYRATIRITNNGATVLEAGTMTVTIDGVTTTFPVNRLEYMESDYIPLQFWNSANETREIRVVVDYVGHILGHGVMDFPVQYIAGSGG